MHGPTRVGSHRSSILHQNMDVGMGMGMARQHGPLISILSLLCPGANETTQHDRGFAHAASTAFI